MSKGAQFRPRISKAVKLVSGVAVRKVEGYRYLRADSEPNWSQRVREREGEVLQVASRPAITTTATSTIMKAIELMHMKRVRGLIVVDSKGVLRGTLTATDVINYLGGGHLYNIVLERHKGDVYDALNSEFVESIMNPSPIYVLTTAKVSETLRVMVLNGVGLLPIVDKQGIPQGVVTEHDMVRHLSTKEVGVKVSDVMTSNLVIAYEDDSLRRVLQLMSIYGFRRLPIVSRQESSIVGVVSAIDVISFFGSHRAFERLTSRSIEDVLSVKASEIMTKDVYTVYEDEDVNTAAALMDKYNTNSLIVVDRNGEAKGIITERDVLLALALR
ncbi:MAG: CBS domain-containing protein [Acidilobus sp.]